MSSIGAVPGFEALKKASPWTDLGIDQVVHASASRLYTPSKLGRSIAMLALGARYTSKISLPRHNTDKKSNSDRGNQTEILHR